MFGYLKILTFFYNDVGEVTKYMKGGVVWGAFRKVRKDYRNFCGGFGSFRDISATSNVYSYSWKYSWVLH